jgi:hypothetical protein
MSAANVIETTPWNGCRVVCGFQLLMRTPPLRVVLVHTSVGLDLHTTVASAGRHLPFGILISRLLLVFVTLIP